MIHALKVSMNISGRLLKSFQIEKRSYSGALHIVVLWFCLIGILLYLLNN